MAIPAQSVRPLDLAVFIRQHRDAGLEQEARREVELLIDLTTKAIARSELADAPYVRFSERGATLIPFDLFEGLERVSVPRRRAVLFALETDLNPGWVETMNWRSIRSVPLTLLAAECARAMPRHIHLPNVFWEAEGTLARPLMGLGLSMLCVAGDRGIEELRIQYKLMTGN